MGETTINCCKDAGGETMTVAKSEEAIKEYDDISYEACVKLMGVVVAFEEQRLKT